MLKLDGYVRVSRVGGRSGDSYISPTVQEQAIRVWIEQNGHTLGRVVVDEDVSGGKMTRPGLDRILRRIESREVDGAVVAALDRFSRVLGEGLQVAARVAEAGGVIVSASEGVIAGNEDAPTLGRDVQLAVAADQLKRYRRQWLTAREHAVRRGVHVASRTPVGYQRGDSSVLEPDPQTAPHVRQAFELRAAGESLATIRRYFARHGVESAAGSEQWAVQSIARVLRNRVYLGEAKSGVFTNPHAHEPIVTRALWEAANMRSGSSRPRSDAEYLLSGVLRCAGCGYAMSARTRHGSHRSYQCRGGGALGACPSPVGIVAPGIEAWAGAEVVKRYGTMSVRRVPDDSVVRLSEQVERLESELVEYRDDSETRLVLGARMHAEGLRSRVERIDALRTELATLAQHDLGIPTTLDLTYLWPRMLDDERRRFIRAMVHAIVVEPVGRGRVVPVGDRARIVWPEDAANFPLPAAGSLPRSGA